MEKMKRKWKGIPAWIIALAMVAVVTVSAVTLIWSNMVTVHVIPKPVLPVYALTLAAPDTVYVGDPIAFTGSLMDTAHSIPVAGATINILDMSSAEVVSTATTIADGTFACSYTPSNPLITTFDFKAQYLAP